MGKNQTARGNSFTRLLLEPVEITPVEIQLVAGGKCKNVCTEMPDGGIECAVVCKP